MMTLATPKKRILTVDPGLHATGLAVWDSGTFLSREALEPVRATTLKCRDMRGYYVAICAFVETWNIRCIICENPEFQAGVRGLAAMRTGSVIKLAEFVGMVSAIGFRYDTVVDLVNVSSWKGNLPKEIVAARVCEVWSGCPFTYKDDAMDAVGIGMWAQGLINKQLMGYTMPTEEQL